MKGYISADSTANRIRMLRSNHKGAFLLVEGDDDEKLYGMFVAPDCRIQVAHGKPNLEGALKILDADRFTGLLAIADADFSQLNRDAITSPNLVRTDTHDLETMLLASPALTKLLHEFGDPVKIGQRDIRLALLELGQPIGYARWFSARQSLSLLFEGLEFDSFIAVKTMMLDRTALRDALQSRSGKGALSATFWDNINATMSNTHDPWHVCQGHDLVEILSLGLRRVFGSQKDGEIKPARLEAALRLAYEKDYFSRTRLWTAIKTWEASNVPYIVLAS